MGQPVLSVVDYEAWNKGYSPPCEHRLIHKLSYEGAKVRAASEIVPGSGWWIVTTGDAFDSEDMWDMIEFITERHHRRIRAKKQEQRELRDACIASALGNEPVLKNAPTKWTP